MTRNEQAPRASERSSACPGPASGPLPRRPGAVGAILAVCVLALTLLAPTLSGCSTVRPLANDGHDLVENSGWPIWVRVPAGLGEALGYLAAIPVSVCLLPTYPFESQVVSSSQSYHVDPPVGDIQIPLVLAPYDYGGGLGATVLGAPFRGAHGLFRDSPGPPPGTLKEEPEPPPGGGRDPALGFEVHPPAVVSEEGDAS